MCQKGVWNGCMEICPQQQWGSTNESFPKFAMWICWSSQKFGQPKFDMSHKAIVLPVATVYLLTCVSPFRKQ